MKRAQKTIEIAVSEETASILEELAKRDHVSLSRKTTELIELALQDDEDRILSKIANSRDIQGIKYLSHDEAWGIARV